MAKDRKKLVHIHSSVSDKQPTPASLEVGEIAVNISADKEFVSFKNSNNKVVRISSDKQIVDLMEYKTVIPYSGTVENINLASNRSNIEIKLNQVVSNNTKFHEKVNGAVDIDGQPINPTSDGGLTNGAGFKIDTSVFVLSGSNPTFSSITSSCHTKLEGTTEIKGLEGSCGSLLDIDADTENVDVKTATTNVSAATTNIATAVTKIADSTLALGSETKTVSGNSTTTIDGTTTVTRKQDVVENNNANYTSNTTGDTTLNNNGDVTIKTNGETNITNGDNVSITNKGNVVNAISGDTTTAVKGTVTVNVTGGTDIKSCDRISSTTNNFVVEECQANNGKFIINETDVDFNGKTFDVVATTSATINSPSVNISGESLTVNETNTVFNSCGSFTVKSNNLKFETCSGSTGSISIGGCADVNVDTDKYSVVECTDGGGKHYVKESDIDFVGSTFDISTISSTTINSPSITLTGTNVTTNASNVVTNGGVVTVNSTSSTTVNAGANLCLNSNTKAHLYGLSSTNVGVSCGGEMTPNVNIGGTNVYISGTTNIAGDTIVKGNTILSGNTTVNNNLTVNGTTTLASGLTSSLEWKYGDVTSANSGKTNFAGNDTSSITIPKDASHITRKTLTVDYLAASESMSGMADTTYDPGATANTTSHTPVYVSNLGRGTLKVEYKNSQCALSGVTDQTYDPGSKTAFDGAVANTIYIPTTIEALDNACGECVSISKDVCVDGKISATQGVFQSSDKVLKENIEYLGGTDMNKSKSVPFRTFNFKNDADKRKMYGVIAQDVEKAGLEELVHYDEKGLRTVDYTGLLILKIAELEYELKKLTEDYNYLKDRVKYK